jgi:hypothetical protein
MSCSKPSHCLPRYVQVTHAQYELAPSGAYFIEDRGERLFYGEGENCWAERSDTEAPACAVRAMREHDCKKAVRELADSPGNARMERLVAGPCLPYLGARS